MTLSLGWLHRLICRQGDRNDNTEKLIDEAERTRRELLRITTRLTSHVEQLKAFTRAYAQQQEGNP